MKKRSSFAAGMLTMALLFGLVGTAYAAYQKQATLNYQDIKITLNGELVTPKDGAGNVVEPFTIDGTTYLPVRAIANAMGLEVGWDSATNTVTLTTPKDEWEGYTVCDCYGDFSVPSLENIVGTAALVDAHLLKEGDSVCYTYDPQKFKPEVKENFREKYCELLEQYGFELCLVEDGPDVEYVDRISGLVVAMYPVEDKQDYYCVLLMSLPDEETKHIIDRTDLYEKYTERWKEAVDSGLTNLPFPEWWLQWREILQK